MDEKQRHSFNEIQTQNHKKQTVVRESRRMRMGIRLESKFEMRTKMQRDLVQSAQNYPHIVLLYVSLHTYKLGDTHFEHINGTEAT